MRIVFTQDHDYCTAKKVHLPGQMSYDKKVYKAGTIHDVSEDFAMRCIRMGVAQEAGPPEPTPEEDAPARPVKKEKELAK